MYYVDFGLQNIMRYSLRDLFFFVTILGLILWALSLSIRYAGHFSNSGEPVRIIIPSGYEGEFSIVKDSVEGQDLTFERGEWVFRIPPEGILRVKDHHPFVVWHEEIWTYEDGRPASLKALSYDGVTLRWKVISSSK